MEVKFFDLKRQYKLLQEELENNIIKTMRSTSYVGGDSLNNFIENMKKYLGVKYISTVNSGTDALIIALIAGGELLKVMRLLLLVLVFLLRVKRLQE